MTQSFDELFWNKFDTLNKDTNLAYNFGSESYNEGHKAGQQSRQAEIDELQKRIDDAVKCMEQNKPSFPMDFKHAVDALSILKGKQND